MKIVNFRKGLFSIGAALTLVIASQAGAYEVETLKVNAHGQNKRLAIERAFELAVEHVSGTRIFSISSEHNGEFSHRSTAYSGGIVRDYEVLESQPLDNDQVAVTVRVSVSHNDAQATGQAQLDVWRGEAHTVNSVNDLQRRMREQERLLVEARGSDYELLQNGYVISHAGYKVEEITPSKVSGYARISVRVNDVFFDAFFDMVKAMQPVTDDTGRIAPWGDYTFDGGKTYYIVHNPDENYKVSSNAARAADLSLPVFVNFVGENDKRDLRKDGGVYFELNANAIGRFVAYRDSAVRIAQVSEGDNPYNFDRYSYLNITPNMLRQRTGIRSVENNSGLNCGFYGTEGRLSYATCGQHFIVKLPVEAANMATFIAQASREIDVNVYRTYSTELFK